MLIKATLIITIIGVILASVMFATFLWLPEWMTNWVHIRETEKYLVFLASTRASVASLLGSVLSALTALTAIGTVYATYRSYLSMQDKQLADTLSKATELLGSQQTPTRLGGIYVLRRMARASEQDYFAVTQILSGHVRDKWCVREKPSTEEDSSAESSCPSDLQAVLTILGERPWKKAEGNHVIDLSRVELHGASFSRSDLSRITFRDSKFFSVDFSNADLRRADLSNCVLFDCSFEKTQLAAATLRGAIFKDAIGLIQAQIESTLGDRTTILPGALQQPDSWKGEPPQRIPS